MNKKIIFILIPLIILSVLVSTVLLGIFVGKHYRNYENSPILQSNTEWNSDDGSIYFSVGDEYKGFAEGVLISDEKQIDIVIYFAGRPNTIYIYDKSSAHDHYFHQTGQTITNYNVTLVKGSFYMIGKDKCIVEIIEQNPVLEVDFCGKLCFKKQNNKSGD